MTSNIVETVPDVMPLEFAPLPWAPWGRGARRRQVFRAYDWTGSIVGGTVVDPGTGQEEAARQLLSDPRVAFVQTRNVVFGCYMLTIRRA